ncbi:MAG: HAAS signaling domain-containing protein [Chitinophagales bacterium]
MIKAEFLTELDRALSGLKYEERRDILADYEEHFRMGLADGKTEAEISAALGQPKAIARAYRADYLVEQAAADKSAGNILRAIFAVISLSFFNLVVVLGPFLGLVGVLLGLWAAGIGVTVAGVAAFGASLFAGPFGLVLPGGLAGLLGVALVGTGLASLGVLACLGLWKLTTLFYRLMVSYLKFNLKVIRG